VISVGMCVHDCEGCCEVLWQVTVCKAGVAESATDCFDRRQNNGSVDVR